MSYESLLTQTCDVSHYSEGAADAYGNPVKTWNTVYPSEPCRLVPSGGREITVDKQVVVSNWLIHLGSTVVITERDRIEIDSETYEVILVQNRSGAAAKHHVEAALMKVT